MKEGIAQDFGCTATRRKKNQKKGEMAEGICAASMRGAASTLLSSSRSMRGVVVQFHATKRLVNAEPFRTIVKAATKSGRPGSSGAQCWRQKGMSIAKSLSLLLLAKKIQSFFRLYKARRKKDRIFLSGIDNGVDSISFAS